jgi:hypothetical protein
MAQEKSPIVEAGLKDPSPSFGVPRERLVIYALRALDFYRHPYFTSNRVLADVIARDLLFESLAFHLRPIAMTDGDDSSIWSTLRTLEEQHALEPDEIESYKARFRGWIALTDEQLRQWWPNWQQLQQLHADVMGVGTRKEELWDRVYGGGAHSDFRRVLRNKIPDLSSAGPESRHALYGKLLATISPVRPLIEDLYADVARVNL